jgi:hypothetical protein
LRLTFSMGLSKQLDGLTHGFYSDLHMVRVVLSKGLELFPVRRIEGLFVRSPAKAFIS